MHVTEGLKDANALRWMAPELLDSNIESPRLTKETDMYAFAMTAIEVRLGFFSVLLNAQCTDQSSLLRTS